ncbi:MAG: murein biosynthesis integral membrane protein MurJ [Betaproteobacteria bacterium]|nr:murein biosynthesis integral membrane protein MurJ [Betaproteobacteria bacterium]
MNLLKALVTVSGMTLLSRVSGFVRDVLQAQVFGAGPLMDAFVVASRLPNLLRRMFAEGAFSQAFVPVLAEYKTREGDESTRELIDKVATSLAIVLAAVTLIGIVAAPLLIYATAAGFAATPDKFDLSVQLLRICFPYIFFVSLVSMAAGILNTWGKMAAPAFTPFFLNLSYIIFTLLAVPYFDPPIMALAWALAAGGVMQLAFQVPFLLKIKALPRWNLDFRHPGVKRIYTLMLPALLGVSVTQISLVINTQYQSFMEEGSVSWLYFADRLMEFPSALLGVTLGTILLPGLSKRFAEADHGEYSRLLDWGLRLTFLLALPAALGLAMLATPIISTLFQGGLFTPEDVVRTREALIAYSVGLIGIILVKILAPGFYARQNIKTPVKIALIALVAVQTMNVLFIFWPLKLGHAGLALSIGLGACLNALLLYRGIRAHDIYTPEPGWLAFLAKLALALALMAGVLWFATGAPAYWFALSRFERAAMLFALVAAGGGVYFAALWLMGFRPGDFKRHA